MNGDDYWRRRMERDRVLRRWFLRRLIKELEVPGKRQSALRQARCLFDATSAEELQALLDAMPTPRTTSKRTKMAKHRQMRRKYGIGSWNDHSSEIQGTADRGQPADDRGYHPWAITPCEK